MADAIIDGTLFNTTNIMYTSPKATSQGAKSVNILNKQVRKGLVLSTPLMLTWGAGEFVDEKTGTGDGKFSLSLQFPSSEYGNEDTDAFFKNMKALEDKIKSDALVNSKEWFGKVHKSLEVVEALWTPMLKYPKDKSTGDYDYSKSPTLKVKLPQWQGEWKFEIYDEDGEKVFPGIPSLPAVNPIEYLKKGSNIMCLIQFAGIWFVNGKFSASWKLVQAVVQKPKATLQGSCFLKLKANDKEKLKTQTVEEDVEDTFTTNVLVVDSDEEEDVVEKEEVLIEKPVLLLEVEVSEENEKEVLPTVVLEETVVVPEVVLVEEPKKKKIVRKKTGAEV
jgi:hypothetical protein